MSRKLTQRQKKFLKGKAHHLSPVVAVGKLGVTTELLRSVDLCLKSHELIKVRVHNSDRGTFDESIAAICDSARAQLLQSIGRIGVLYRPNPKLLIALPT